MTKAEWISRLRKAKARALELYPSEWCILDACAELWITWSDIQLNTAKFSMRPESPQISSVGWMEETKPTREQVAAVFDESIRLAGGEP